MPELKIKWCPVAPFKVQGHTVAYVMAHKAGGVTHLIQDGIEMKIGKVFGGGVLIFPRYERDDHLMDPSNYFIDEQEFIAFAMLTPLSERVCLE